MWCPGRRRWPVWVGGAWIAPVVVGNTAGMADPQHARDHADGSIEEPENSTVDDWFGQNAARDADVADEILAEEDGDEAAAERRFDDEAEGEEKYKAGHPRPGNG